MFDFIGTLAESRLLPSTNSYSPFSAEDLSELAVLYICSLWMMYCDKDSHEKAISYANKTIQYGVNFEKWRTGGTDLYNILHGLMADDIKLDRAAQSEKFKFHVPIGKAALIRWLREMANGHVQVQTHRSFFVNLDFNFKIGNNSIRAVRRLAMDWKTINFGERSLCMTRLLQMLRARALKGEILPLLNSMAREKELEIFDNPPQATERGGGFLAALAAGVKVANKVGNR